MDLDLDFRLTIVPNLSVLKMLLRIIAFTFLFLVFTSSGNVIENGDFESGELAPWTCARSTCSVLDTNQLSW